MYVGEWHDSKMHGEGVFFFAYGGFMMGNFVLGKINGTSILNFPNNNTYIG